MVARRTEILQDFTNIFNRKDSLVEDSKQEMLKGLLPALFDKPEEKPIDPPMVPLVKNPQSTTKSTKGKQAKDPQELKPQKCSAMERIKRIQNELLEQTAPKELKTSMAKKKKKKTTNYLAQFLKESPQRSNNSSAFVNFRPGRQFNNY